MKTSSKYWWLGLVRGVIFLLLAFFIVKLPKSNLLAFVLYLHITLLFTGLIECIIAIELRKNSMNWMLKLGGGILDIFYGVVLLIYPDITPEILTFLVGLWFIIKGAIGFVDSFLFKKEGYTNWFWIMLTGILAFVFGFFVTNDLIPEGIALTSWVGSGFLIIGILNVLKGFKLKPAG